MVTENEQDESENENEGISWIEKKALKMCSNLRWKSMVTLEDVVPI
jgi:hypothetical protein